MSATKNPTEALYTNQALHIVEQWKRNNQTTETWRMAGDAFYVMQGTLIRATLHDQLVSNKLLTSYFRKSFFNKDGAFGFSFEGCATKLSVPWHDVIHCSNVIMLENASISHIRGVRYFISSQTQNMPTMCSANPLQNTLVTHGFHCSYLPPTKNA